MTLLSQEDLYAGQVIPTHITPSRNQGWFSALQHRQHLHQFFGIDSWNDTPVHYVNFTPLNLRKLYKNKREAKVQCSLNLLRTTAIQVGRDSWRSSVQPPVQSINYSRFLRAKEGDSHNSSGHLLHCLDTLKVKSIFLTPDVNLLCCRSCLLPLFLLPYTPEKSLPLSALHLPIRYI